jgi:hypothetical protein
VRHRFLRRQPGQRRRDPARLIPTLCRCHVASAIDTPRARRFTRTVRNTYRRCDHPIRPHLASDLGYDPAAKLLGRTPRAARRTSQLPASAQPNHQIPISLPCTPRVRSSGTFGRQAASETLHESGMTALGIRNVRAAIRSRIGPGRSRPQANLRDGRCMR